MLEAVQGEQGEHSVIGPIPLVGEAGPDAFEALEIPQPAGLTVALATQILASTSSLAARLCGHGYHGGHL
ncbi:hypothetical protein AB5J72_35720 [Streptomyces sp. CG1]|uniref:hypothetical protein n=1 Tax=Streptomyces sp. CG1 TaxID=1287523 RepID=UPI0034E1E82E